MTEPRIDRLRPSDWEIYRALRLGSLEESPDAFGSTHEAEARQDDRHWQSRLSKADPESDYPIVAKLDDEPMGLAWARIEPESQVAGHIYQMWVSPEARGRGVGGALMRAMIAWFETMGIDLVELDVTLDNTSAVRLYERYGFRRVGDPEPLRPGSSVRAGRMHLRL